MHHLGFQYNTQRKSFMLMVTNAMRLLQIVMHSSANITTELITNPIAITGCNYQLMKQKLLRIWTSFFGYSYLDIVSKEERIEFHLDNYSWNQIIADDSTNQQSSHQQMKPTTIIRVSLQTRPLMIVGQDMSVFAQYLLCSKTWVGPKGQCLLLPKSEGDGYML